MKPIIPPNKPSNPWLIIMITFIVATIVVGVGVYFWQQSKINEIALNSTQQTKELQNQYADLYNKFSQLLKENNLPIPKGVLPPEEEKFCEVKNVKQGVYGRVGHTGLDCGIVPGSCTIREYEAVEYIYITSGQTRAQYDKKLLVKKIQTDERGCFEADLPIGDYWSFAYDGSKSAQDQCKKEDDSLQDNFETCDNNGRYKFGSSFSVVEKEVVEKDIILSGSVY